MPHRTRPLVVTAVAVTVLATAPAPPAQADELPIPVHTATLSNGLRVVLSPDRSAPTVAIAVYYDVGARVEEPGRSGFAHLFEHMMFEGSANVPNGVFDQLISQHGGQANGTTSEDRTNYYETLPSNALELGLWLEADRMRALDVTPANFETQREVVLEERRQSYENQAYQLSLLRRDEIAYGAYYPYAHSVIGDPADLRRATFADVRAFHQRWYLPNNAVLAIAGDFDRDAALALVRRHFERIPRGPTPQWTDPGLPPQTAERVESMTDPLAELPGFHLVWHVPPRRTPDHYALDLLATILADGESSRLYQSLVKTREVANSIEIRVEDRRGPDLFTVWCVLAQGHTPAAVRPLVYQAIEDIARNGVTGRELEKARNRVRAQFVFDLQANMQRAQALAEFEMYDGNAALLRTELDRYLAVPLADIQRVAARYLTAQNRTVLDVLPPANAANGSGNGGQQQQQQQEQRTDPRAPAQPQPRPQGQQADGGVR